MFNRIINYIIRRVQSYIRTKRLKKIEETSIENNFSILIPKIKYEEDYPKKVYQTYPSKELPEEILKSNNKLKELNPEWEFHLYDDNDIKIFIENKFPKLIEYYNSIDSDYGAARADFFRYLLLYSEGGVYLDIKSSFTKPLNDLLIDKKGFVLSHWDNNNKDTEHYRFGMHPEINIKRGEFLQCVIITPKGHPYLRQVIKNMLCHIKFYNKNLHGIGRFGVLRVTGPIVFTNAIQKVRNNTIETFCDLFKEGFIYNILENKSHHTLFKKHYSTITKPIIMKDFRE